MFGFVKVRNFAASLWRNVDVNYTVLSGVISIARSVLKTPENDGIHRTFSAEIGQSETCG